MAEPAKRLWLVRLRQFSLRTGMILFLLVSIAFGLAAHLYHGVLKRGGTQSRLIEITGGMGGAPWRRGAAVVYESESKLSDWTTLMRKYVHPEFERRFSSLSITDDDLKKDPQLDLRDLFGVTDVYFSAPVDSPSIAMVFGIKGMKELKLYLSKPSGAAPSDWRSIYRATELELLTMEGEPIGREISDEIGKLPKLERIVLGRVSAEGFVGLCKVENLTYFSMGWTPRGVMAKSKLSSEEEHQLLRQGLDELSKRTKLNTLQINGRFPLNAAALTQFCSTSPLGTLKLKWTELEPDCLKEVARLPNLVKLELQEPQVKDEHLLWLAESKSLKKIDIAPGPNNSSQGILALQKLMPDCEISRD